MKRIKKQSHNRVSAKFDEILKPYKMLEQYKKTIEDQTPFWKKQRRDYRNKNKMPSDRIIEAEKFRRDYLAPWKRPKGLVEEMYRQAIDESTL